MTLIQPTPRRKGRIWPLYVNTAHIVSSATVLSYHDLSCSTHKLQLSRVLKRDKMSNPGSIFSNIEHFRQINPSDGQMDKSI